LLGDEAEYHGMVGQEFPSRHTHASFRTVFLKNISYLSVITH
jgi:hypothetical protein